MGLGKNPYGEKWFQIERIGTGKPKPLEVAFACVVALFGRSRQKRAPNARSAQLKK